MTALRAIAFRFLEPRSSWLERGGIKLGSVIETIKLGVLFLLAIALFCIELYALVDAIRSKGSWFTAAGKLSKPVWVGILAISAALGFLGIPIGPARDPLGFLAIIAVVAAGIYLADVKPALRQVRGGNTSGPYGMW